jgi:hypothetical protein
MTSPASEPVARPGVFTRLRKLALYDGGLPLLWIALAVVQLVPVFSQRMLPMLELPRDLAVARVWHSTGNPDYNLAEYFAPMYRPWPGTLVYWLLHLALYFFQIETAGKIVLCLYLVLFPISIAVLARALGRSPWLAILAFPLLFNRAWMFGYSGLLLGGAMMFFALAMLIRVMDRGRGQLALILFSLLAYFGNLATFGVFALAAIGIVFFGRRGPHLRPTLFALGPVTAMALAFVLDSSSERVLGDEWLATFRDFPTLISDFPKRVLDVMPGSLDLRLLLAPALTLLVLCVSKGVREPESSPQKQRLLVIVTALFASYSLLPWELKQPLQEVNYAARMAPLLAAGLVLLPRRPLEGAQRLLLLPVIALSVYLPLKLNRSYRDFSRRNSGFLRLAHETPRGSTTIVLISGLRYSRESIDVASDPSVPGAVFWNWGGWPLALNGGYAPYVLDDSPFVRVVKSLRAPKQPIPDRVPLRQIPHFDFYFTRGITDSFDREPALRIVDQFGDWTLLKRIYELSDEP